MDIPTFGAYFCFFLYAAGALGKRTRYQQEHKAQLVVRVTRDEDVQPLPPVGLCDPEFSAPVPKVGCGVCVLNGEIFQLSKNANFAY